MNFESAEKIDWVRLVLGIVFVTILSAISGIVATNIIKNFVLSAITKEVLIGIAAGIVAIPLSIPMLKWSYGKKGASLFEAAK